MFFNRTCWIENLEVADRFIDILNDPLKSDEITNKNMSDFKSGAKR